MREAQILLEDLQRVTNELTTIRNETLSELRHKEGWSLRQLSVITGMSKTTIATLTG